MLMDKAYEGNETRQLVLGLGMIPVVLPKPTGSTPGNMTANSTKSALWSNFKVPVMTSAQTTRCLKSCLQAID